MNTRTATDDSVFHQSRYASSPEFERGLLANLVAKRCALLDDKSEIELVWFIHYLSHQPGGLAAATKDLLAKYPDRIQTEQMADQKLKRGKICQATQVRTLRKGCGEHEDLFLLRGEIAHSFYGICNANELREYDGWNRSAAVEEAGGNPTSYPADTFFELCQDSARADLEKELARICLDPQRQLTEGQPWYFPQLISTLREYESDFVKRAGAAIAVTALGAKIYEVLDYTFYGRGLTLVEGNARLGKSFAARDWCLQHPGQARFVEVPPSNDEASFFRALARGLGLGSFLKYKVAEIRERVESVLFTGDILLVLDEAERLWPQRNLRRGFPSRIVWVMTMANSNVPICMVSTPQFFQTQIALEKNGWNSAQLTGRISHFESLPTDLEPSDLMAVAKSVLPEADSTVLRALAVYARSSARYLAAIESIAKRARFLAMRAGRKAATTGDVRKAMQESVIPADSKLLRALEAGRSKKPARLTAPMFPPATSQEMQEPPPEESRAVGRGIVPMASGSRRRAGSAADLVAA